MQVHSSFSPNPVRRPANFNKSTAEPVSGDKVTLSSGREPSLGTSLAWGGLSALPFVGLATHQVSATNLYWTGAESAEKVAMVGAAANAIGSLALVAGAVFGSGGSVATGLGLLAVSGGAGAYAYNQMS